MRRRKAENGELQRTRATTRACTYAWRPKKENDMRTTHYRSTCPPALKITQNIYL